MPGVSFSSAMAGWFPLPALSAWQWVACARRALAVRRMRLSILGDGRDNLSGHPHAAAVVVPRDVVGDDPEEWRQRFGTAASVGLAPVRDGLDVAAYTAPGDGS